jgi:ethanolamine ammonia-lyase large subunit
MREQKYSFGSLKEVLAKASEEKSGDIMAGVAAGSYLERMAAKVVLSNLTLQEIYDNPVIPYETDEVTRVIYDDINEFLYNEIKSLTVGELRNVILSHGTDTHKLARISQGLTS